MPSLTCLKYSKRGVKHPGHNLISGKTVIIPVGNETYRSTLVTSRHPNANANAIADEITILEDKTPTRILGAMIGNKIDYMTGWPKILEKISKSLKQWEKFNPLMEGRRLIILMIVGGMTQYYTMAQGMPKQVENTLQVIIQNYIWNSTARSPPHADDTMFLPFAKEGQKLLDIKS